MDTHELELIKKERIENLNKILDSYRSTSRKSKRVLEVIFVLAGVALYWIFFDLLGGFWGFVVTIAIIGVGICCVENLGLSCKNAPQSEVKLSYQACIEMEALIKIENGTYSEYGVNIIGVGQGKHLSLYKEFVKSYPEFESKDLEKLSNKLIEQKDIFN